MIALTSSKRGRRDADRMTLVEHLAELRTRLLVSLVSVAAGSVVGFALSDQILRVLVRPYCAVKGGPDCVLVFFDPLEGFATRFKIAAFTGLLLASPVVLWQVWRFVTPGLHPTEKRYAIPFVCASVVLFVAGAVLAVYTFPKALGFLVSVGGPNLEPLFSPGKYLRLFLLVVFSFGLAFELPILLVFLQLAGVLSSARLRAWRRGAIVAIFVVAAVVTPSQDPITLLMLAVPMYLLYEAAILAGRLLKR